MAITTTTARDRCRVDYLDDDGTRWDATQTDRALQFALSSVFDEYLTAGGDQFVETVTGTTTSGSLDLSTYTPAQVYGVALVFGDRYHALRHQAVRDRQYADTDNRDLSIELCRKPVLGGATQAMVSDGSGNALNTWDDFDDLVCARAALSMAIKDGRRLPALEGWAGQLAQTVMQRPRVPRARAMPFGKGFYEKHLYWFYDAPNETLRLFKRIYS